MKRRTRKSVGVKLPAQFDIRVVREVHASLREELLRSQGLQVDASAVQTTDTAALQLLLVARRAAQSAGHSFEWIETSEALRATSRLLGLAELLGLEAKA